MESTVVLLQITIFLNVLLPYHVLTTHLNPTAHKNAIQQKENASVLQTQMLYLLKETFATTILVLQFMETLLVEMPWELSAQNTFVTLLKVQLVLNAQITFLHPVRF